MGIFKNMVRFAKHSYVIWPLIQVKRKTQRKLNHINSKLMQYNGELVSLNVRIKRQESRKGKLELKIAKLEEAMEGMMNAK